MKFLKSIVLLSLFNASVLFATDHPAISDGQKLHDGKCMACHGTEVYSRLDRKINELELLRSRVKGCAKNAVKADWNDAQINSIVDYLNKEFYEF